MYEIGLVILDPLRSLTACVDKGPSDLQPFARFLRRLIQETGCAVWCAHHETKPLPGFAVDDRRAAQRSSGGGLFSAMDARISIERIDDMQSRFVPDGYKHCETPPPFILRRFMAGNACYIRAVDAPVNQTGAELALLDEIRDWLRQHPASSGRQVERAIRKQADKVRAALDILADKGEARFTTKGKAHLWSLL
jgi:AAA domain